MFSVAGVCDVQMSCRVSAYKAMLVFPWFYTTWELSVFVAANASHLLLSAEPANAINVMVKTKQTNQYGWQ